MKLKYLIFFVFIFLNSCSKKEKNKGYTSYNNDSVNYYYGLSKNEKLDINKKVLFLNKALSNLEFQNNNKENRNKLSEITFDFYKYKDLNNFNKSASLLLRKSKEKKDSVNLGKAYRSKSFYFKDINELDSSLIYNLKAEKIYAGLNEPMILGNLLFNKGVTQYDGGDFLGAELSLNRAYGIFKDSDKKDKLYGVLNQLGLTYNELKEYDKALFYQNKALETVQKYNLSSDFHEEAVCYNNIGYLYLKLKKYTEATINLELALKDKKIITDDPELYSLLLDNLAYSRLQSSNFKDLPDLFYEALKIREKTNNYSGKIATYIHLSEYFFIKNDINKSIFYSQKAIEDAKKSKIPINKILALKHAAIVDVKNSLDYTKRYIAISDSLQLAERKSKDRFARIQLETDEIIQEKDSLEDKNRNLLFIIFGTAGFFLIFYYLRAQRAKNRELIYKQAQQKANEDIFNLMMSQQAVIDESRANEKQKLARELHDGVLGRMFGLRLSLDSVNRLNNEEALMKRNQIINELKTIEQDIREISHDLNREKQVLINNFVSIVTNLIEEQKETYDAKVSFFLDNSIHWDKIPNAVKINLYRILQESLQNINKYAHAKNINIGFVKNDHTIIFKISDDGIGFDVNKKSKGIGTQNMLARTKECNGTIEILSDIGEGTTITITIPLSTETNSQNNLIN